MIPRSPHLGKFLSDAHHRHDTTRYENERITYTLKRRRVYSRSYNRVLAHATPPTAVVGVMSSPLFIRFSRRHLKNRYNFTRLYTDVFNNESWKTIYLGSKVKVTRHKSSAGMVFCTLASAVLTVTICSHKGPFTSPWQNVNWLVRFSSVLLRYVNTP